MDPQKEPSLGELLGDLTRETGTLVRQEMKLASLELGEKARVASRDLRLVALGGILTQAGLVIAMGGLVVVLAAYLPLWASALVIGGVAMLGGAVLVRSGLTSLRRLNPAPTQTLETLREDRSMLKEQLR